MALPSGTNNLHSGAHPFLSEIICLAQDTDLESNTFICKTLVTLKSTKLTKLMRSLDGLSHCLAFTERLLTVRSQSQSQSRTVFIDACPHFGF